ncbi:MAG: cyclic nucleotide-binding domain-containing protein [Candidatus Cloacimonetes bacterium]|jgi:CRP/FNR family transcriptional regulator, cyclic AMP receptor protein|nr:cyclic nucleotide-binding domain-containing protein [Candidatus Cloacimonadota bacterium]MBT6993691.1 cyclic nucleotide-binding domain-containing protein [Candidatus Cloacimonadota bacterium]MBT7469638.1 cyclic nucleotide-binding domain-containing protein [Candidatus Cloacimonadota bacterium]
MNINIFKKKYEKNDIIVKQGDNSTDIYKINKGKVLLKNSNKMSFVELNEGDLFGTVDFILEKPYRFTAVAVTDVEIDIIDPRIFTELYESENAEFIKPILLSLAEEIRFYESKLEGKGGFVRDIIATAKRSEKKILTLIPTTSKAKRMLRNLDRIVISHFPFKIGRHSRRRSDKLFHRNDFYLSDYSPYSVSRSHFAITKKDNDYYFLDRGSHLGTLVNGERIGGRGKRTRVSLSEKENSIIIGSVEAKIRFKLEILPA